VSRVEIVGNVPEVGSVLEEHESTGDVRMGHGRLSTLSCKSKYMSMARSQEEPRWRVLPADCILTG